MWTPIAPSRPPRPGTPTGPATPTDSRTGSARSGGRSALALLAALLFVAGTLAACGGSSSSNTPPGGGGPGTDTFVAATAGQSFFVALDADGDAWSWGFNADGELGDGTTANRTTPVPVSMPAGVRFEQVDGGSSHALALDASGRAWAWGGNFSGQLGDGTTTFRYEPTGVAMPAGVRFRQVAAGHMFSLALDEDGRAWAWGLNNAGKLGDGTTIDRHQPVAVTMPGGVTFTKVAASMFNAFALDADGHAWAWGDNSNGMLGDGSEIDTATPVRVDMPGGVAFTHLVAGASHAAALNADGDAWEIGLSWFSEGPPGLVDMPSGTAFTDVSVGQHHVLALDQAGGVWAWGLNWTGQIGDGTHVDRDRPVRVDLPADVVVVDVAAGLDTSLAVADDGATWAWGYNLYGELGNGTLDPTDVPVAVTLP